MLEEQWATLDLVPNYEISNYGRIVNTNTGRELTPTKDKNGYYRVVLCNKGDRRHVFVHRLVAECYFLNYQTGIEVKHKNLDKGDNGVFNLTLGSGCRVGTALKRE